MRSAGSGGDEFLVLMADTDATIASRVAERIRHAITDTPVPTRDGAMSVSVSVGCTVRQPNDTTAVEASARARRSSADAVESRGAQSRSNGQLIPASRPRQTGPTFLAVFRCGIIP